VAAAGFWVAGCSVGTEAPDGWSAGASSAVGCGVSGVAATAGSSRLGAGAVSDEGFDGVADPRWARTRAAFARACATAGEEPLAVSSASTCSNTSSGVGMSFVRAYMGPEIPPSFLTLQKWIEMKIVITNGSSNTCSVYHRIKVSGPISGPPSKANCTWDPITGEFFIISVPTVTAHTASWSHGSR
jgi:hypothetical protein